MKAPSREEQVNWLRAVLAAIAEGYDYSLHDHSSDRVGYFIVVENPNFTEEKGALAGAMPNLTAQIDFPFV